MEAEEDLDFKVAGKVTVGGNGGGELIFLFEGGFSSNSFFAGDRARAVDDRQALLLRFDEVTGKLVRYGGYLYGVMYMYSYMGLDPHRCSTKLSVRPCLPVVLAGSGQWHSYAKYKRLVAADHRSTSARMQELLGNYSSIALRLRTFLERAPLFRHQARPWAGVQYVKRRC